MQLHRVVLSWSGPNVVGQAVTVLHFAGDAQPAPPVAAIKAALTSGATIFSNQTGITVPGSGDTIEDTTGALVGTWTASGGGLVAGGVNSNVAAGVGACIGWTTGGIVTGTKGPRRLRGRTFLVPLGVICYDATGTLTPEALVQIENIASGLQGAGPLAVWHRPTTAGGTNGNSYGVISHKVRDKVAVLRSRRD